MIHYFNPGHETAVLNQSPYYMPPANVAMMQGELAFLPAWYADKGDVILINRPLNAEFTQYLKQLTFPIKAIINDELYNVDKETVALWGVSPQAIHYFEELNTSHDLHLQLPVWNERLRDLNSRLFARDSLCKLIDSIPSISKDVVPYIIDSLDDIHSLLSHSESLYLSKAPYSSSGRGLLWLPKTGLTQTENQILHGILKKQKVVLVEKVLNKNIDFAMEFFSDGNGNIEFQGYSLFHTNEKGGYLSNYLISQPKIEESLSEKIPQSLLNQVKESLRKILEEDCASIYRGCIGVDMMIYCDDIGQYALHPCVEINLRYNMGYLSMKIYNNYISPLAEGNFYLDFYKQQGEVYKKHEEMKRKYPLSVDNKKITSGYLPLCPVEESSRFWAYILVK